MSPARSSGALLEKLGAPASAELIELLDTTQRATTEALMTQCSERFERRLVEETSTLRVEITQLRGETRSGFAHGRGEMRESVAGLRGEMRESVAGLRGEVRETLADLRGEMRQGFAEVRRDIAVNRFELLRWSFAFWVGQLAAVAAVVGLLLRTMSPR